MKQFILYISLILTPLVMTSQVAEHVSIQWSEMLTQKSVKDIEVNYFSFSGATNLNRFGALPLFYSQVDLPGDVFNCELFFNIKQADTLSLELSELLSDSDLLQNHYLSLLN